MKKITSIIVLLISITGFSQNLVTNGDFQTGTAAPWYNNAANVVDLGAGNFVNQANITAAGNPWDVNLSQEILLEDGKTYKLTFTAFTDSTTGTRTILSGIGQTAAPYNSLTSTTTLTATPQTFNYDITINYGNAVADRVLFDMGAATGFVFIDNVSVVEVLPLIQNFEAPVTYTSLASFNGASALVVADPASGGSNGQVLSGTQGPAGDPWQGIEFVQTAKKAKLTTNKTMTVDVYCSQAFNILAKVDQGGTGPVSANGQAYTTPGQWQTLTFNFAAPMDGTAAANGEYQKIIFFGNWKATNDGFNSPLVPLTFYVDNVRSMETSINSDPAPTTSAPNPTIANADVVLSYFNDKPGFTSAYVAEDQFGTRTLINLDAENDQTIKMNFGVAGWGQYNNTTVNITAANYFHFDYYVPTFAAGSNGHGFWIMLNSGSGEKQFRIEAANIVFDSWQTISVPMSHFTNLGFNKATLLSWKLGSDSDLNTKFVYFDNLYFTVNALNNDSFTKNSVSIYPNPAKTNLTIEANDLIEYVTVYNLLGQEVISKTSNNQMVTLDVSNLQVGVYVVKTSINGTVATSRFIKQ